MKKTHLMMPVENQETLPGITVGEMVSNQRQNLSERLNLRIEKFPFHLLKPYKSKITMSLPGYCPG